MKGFLKSFFKREEKFIFFAHRGAPGLAPENTLNSFAQAKARGMKYFETDLHLTRDGVPVLIHDADTLRVSGHEFIIAQTDYKDLQTVDIQGQKIPSLEQLLDMLGAEDFLNIEIKTDAYPYAGIENKVLALLKAKNRVKNTLISSFNFETLRKTRRLDKEIKIGALQKEFSVTDAREVAAYSIHLSKNYVTRGHVEQAHKNNFKVYVYTVNTKEDLRRIKQLGTDGVFTDDPSLAGEEV